MSPNIENISTADQAKLYIGPVGDRQLFSVADQEFQEYVFHAMKFHASLPNDPVTP